MGILDFTRDTPQDQGTLDFSRPATPGPSMMVAAARAHMFQQGLDPVLNRDPDDLRSIISSGGEDGLRDEAAANIDLTKTRLQQDAARRLPLIANPSDEAVKKITTPIEPTNPKTVAEEAWGQQYVQKIHEAAYGNMKDTTYAQATKDYPRLVEYVKRQGGIIAAQNQVVYKWAQDARDAVNRQSNIYAGYERGLSFIPGHDEITIRHQLANILPGMEKLGFGDYLREASMRLLSLPFDQFAEVMETTFKPWIEQNPHTAAYVLDQLINQSTSDRYFQNFSTLLDATAIPGLGFIAKGLTKGAKSLLGLTKEVADVTADGLTRLKWTGTQPPELHDIPEGWWADYRPGTKEWYLVTARRAAEAAGDTREAGIQAAAESMANPNKPKQAVDALPAALRLDKDRFTANIGNGGRELKIRIENSWEALDGVYKDLMQHMPRIDTLSDVMKNEAAARIIENAIRNAYKGLNNSIGEVKYLGRDKFSNAYRYELHITDPDTTPWKSFINAQTNRNLNGLGDVPNELVKEGPGIQREGMGFKLVRHINLKEDMRAITDLIAETDQGKLQVTKGMWPLNLEGTPIMEATNRYRNPREILSRDENIQRQIATHTPNVLLALSEQTLEPLKSIAKGLPLTPTRKRWSQFWRAVEHAKFMDNPETGKQGKWFQDGAEMDDFFLRNFNRPAEPYEKEAYLAIVRNIELNRMHDIVNLYSMKAKAGVEQHSLSFYNADGKKINSKFIEGTIARDIKDFSLSPETPVYVQRGKAPGKVYSWGSESRHGKNPMSKLIAEGKLKAIQVENPDWRPLNGFGNIKTERVQWIITDQVETVPLSWENQIPRQGGGHFVWDYNYLIKQAKMTKDGKYWWHEGDTTLMPISIRAMGNDIVKHLNAVQLHLREGREEAAEAYHNNNNLPMSWEEHRGWYRDSHENGEYKPARANLNEPWVLVPKDKSVEDMINVKSRYGNFYRNSAEQGNPSRTRMIPFTGERDVKELMTINNEGTRYNPLYRYQPAQFADPIHVMNRALTRSVKSLWMQDMKNYSMYHFLKQAVEHMDIDSKDPMKTVMNSPAYYFNNAEQFWRKGADPGVIQKLENARHQMKQFIGVPSKIETDLFRIQQGIADMLYEKGFRTIPDWLMHEARDPFAYVRSAIVHMKLGLFNPQSFFVQASTHLNIWGIAGPRHAAPGALATYLETLARRNPRPEVLAHLDSIASKSGWWRPGEWLEAYHEFQYRGTYNIGHTHAFIDAHYQAKPVMSKYGMFLDWGHTPFREGARSVRTAAWFTAYHEWRYGPSSSSWTGGKSLAHPTGKLAEEEWNLVEDRATDLDHNMDRASNSRMNAGFMSFPMQFQTYHKNLLELMTGKRLTPQEKLGLFTASSIAYGIPVGGIGLYSPFANVVANQIQQTAQEHGYRPNDKFITDVVMRGLPDAMAGAAFGVQGNVGERWGPGKFTIVEDLLNGSLTWWKAISGATGSTLANIYENSGPLIKAGLAFIQGKPDFPITAEDWLRPLEEISSVSTGVGIWKTLETGRLLSKNGAFISDVSRSKYAAAFMRYVVGLTPQTAADIKNNLEWKKAEEEGYKEAEKNIIRELHAWYDAKNNNDPDAAANFLKRAYAYSVGLPQDVKTRIWAYAPKSYGKPLDMTILQQRAKAASPDKQQVLQEIYRKTLEEQGH